MTTLRFTPRALLALLQWCDSLFPSGAFSHSFGLESAVQSSQVKDVPSLILWIQAKISHQIFPCDAVLIWRACEAAESKNLDMLRELDTTAYALRLVRELREGGKMIASRLMQTTTELYPNDWTFTCQKALESGQLKGDAAVAFGLAACAAGISKEAALVGYCYLFISGQVSAALRLLPIGQQSGQKIIHEVLEWTDHQWITRMQADWSLKEPMSFMPASEIGTMQHETAPVRLFQS